MYVYGAAGRHQDEGHALLPSKPYDTATMLHQDAPLKPTGFSRSYWASQWDTVSPIWQAQ
jgi:hypothetical protein